MGDVESASSSTSNPPETSSSLCIEVHEEIQLHGDTGFGASARQTDDQPALHNHGAEIYSWLEDELTEAFDDRSTAQALVACVEVILADESTEEEHGVLANVVDLLTGEGVPQQIIDKL